MRRRHLARSLAADASARAKAQRDVIGALEQAEVEKAALHIQGNRQSFARYNRARTIRCKEVRSCSHGGEGRMWRGPTLRTPRRVRVDRCAGGVREGVSMRAREGQGAPAAWRSARRPALAPKVALATPGGTWCTGVARSPSRPPQTNSQQGLRRAKMSEKQISRNRMGSIDTWSFGEGNTSYTDRFELVVGCTPARYAEIVDPKALLNLRTEDAEEYAAAQREVRETRARKTQLCVLLSRRAASLGRLQAAAPMHPTAGCNARCQL